MSSTSTTWTTDTNTKSGVVQVYSSNVSVLRVVADEGESAILDLFADQGDDNADKWRMWVNASDDDLHFSNYTSGTAWTDILTLQDGGNVGIATDAPASKLHVAGTVQVGVDGTAHDVVFYSDTAGDNFTWDASEEKLIITGTNGQTSLDVADGNVTIADDLAVDGTSNLDNTDIDGTLVVDGSNISLDSSATFNIDCSNTSNGVTVATATSGVPISIGHATSETTVNDNLTVTGTTALNDDITVAAGKKIYFDSTDTYIYSNADDPEDLVIGADADIILEPDGNVGIGTTSPVHELTISSPSTAGPALELKYAGDADPTAGTAISNQVLGEILFSGNDSNINAASGGAQADNSSIGAKIVATATAAWGDAGNDNDDSPTKLEFFTQSDGTGETLDAARMTILSDGNVGIGTNDPNKVGYGSNAKVLTVADYGSAGDYGVVEIGGYRTNDGTSGELAFPLLDSSGDLSSSGYIRGIRDGANDASGLQFLTEATGAGATVKMTILGSGNVGIGYATPEQTLDVVSAADTFIRVDSSSGTGDVGILFEGQSTQKWKFWMDQSDTYALNIVDHDNGQGVQLQQNDGDGWGTYSDERWKANWSEYTNALDGLNTLSAGKYQDKNLAKDGEIGSVWNSGLKAQEVEKILPHAVHTGECLGMERKLMTYNSMIPYMVKAIQELSAKVTALESA
jgi:hypothetical protein